MKIELEMSVLKEEYSVCRLECYKSIPTWALEGNFSSITRTEDELSLVCESANVPDGIEQESGWKTLKINGPLDFGLIGILASITSVLADNKISVFAISTYDTDYIMVKEAKLELGIKCLENAGCTIIS